MTASTSAASITAASRKPWRLALLLFFSYAALIAQFQGIQNILVPSAVERIAPAAKVATLAWLGTASAIATVAAMLVAGWLSDRTRSRWGRRMPWLVGWAAATAIASALLGRAGSVAALLVAMPALWFVANAYQTVLTTLLPDRVAPEHQGFVSAAIALGVPIGIFGGVNVAVLAPGPTGYLLLNVPLLVATLLLVAIEREPEPRSAPMLTSDAGQPASGWLSGFRHRDFTLAFFSRFVLFLAFFTASGYLLYAMSDYVGRAHLPGGDPGAAVGRILSLTTIAWLVVTPFTGLLADRVAHTAGVVGVTSVAIGLVMLVPALSNGWPAMLVFGTGLGLTFGIYFAIDLKLIAMVLPSARDAGRDIGLMSIAGSGPTVFAPALAAAIIQQASYPALFLVGAVLAVAGGALAFPIRARNVPRRRG